MKAQDITPRTRQRFREIKVHRAEVRRQRHASSKIKKSLEASKVLSKVKSLKTALEQSRDLCEEAARALNSHEADEKRKARFGDAAVTEETIRMSIDKVAMQLLESGEAIEAAGNKIKNAKANVGHRVQLLKEELADINQEYMYRAQALEMHVSSVLSSAHPVVATLSSVQGYYKDLREIGVQMEMTMEHAHLNLVEQDEFDDVITRLKANLKAKISRIQELKMLIDNELIEGDDLVKAMVVPVDEDTFNGSKPNALALLTSKIVEKNKRKIHPEEIVSKGRQIRSDPGLASLILAVHQQVAVGENIIDGLTDVDEFTVGSGEMQEVIKPDDETNTRARWFLRTGAVEGAQQYREERWAEQKQARLELHEAEIKRISELPSASIKRELAEMGRKPHGDRKMILTRRIKIEKVKFAAIERRFAEDPDWDKQEERVMKDILWKEDENYEDFRETGVDARRKHMSNFDYLAQRNAAKSKKHSKQSQDKMAAALKKHKANVVLRPHTLVTVATTKHVIEKMRAKKSKVCAVM